MQKHNIPKTDLTASALVLGTELFGSTISREMSIQLMDLYIEAGGSMIDTAEVYACWLPGGEHRAKG
jgi:aryl-alcohol dehydrogenase-like predicted oxidoreductase